MKGLELEDTYLAKESIEVQFDLMTFAATLTYYNVRELCDVIVYKVLQGNRFNTH